MASEAGLGFFVFLVIVVVLILICVYATKTTEEETITDDVTATNKVEVFTDLEMVTTKTVYQQGGDGTDELAHYVHTVDLTSAIKGTGNLDTWANQQWQLYPGTGYMVVVVAEDIFSPGDGDTYISDLVLVRMYLGGKLIVQDSADVESFQENWYPGNENYPGDAVTFDDDGATAFLTLTNQTNFDDAQGTTLGALVDGGDTASVTVYLVKFSCNVPGDQVRADVFYKLMNAGMTIDQLNQIPNNSKFYDLGEYFGTSYPVNFDSDSV